MGILLKGYFLLFDWCMFDCCVLVVSVIFLVLLINIGILEYDIDFINFIL